MKHSICYIKSPSQVEAFSGLILPSVLPRLSDPAVLLIGAVDGSQPVGAAVLALEPDRAQLLSIAVTAGHRRHGIGSALLRQCIRLLHRTSIQTLSAMLLPEETDAAALLAAFGMESQDSGVSCRLTLGAALAQTTLRGSTPKTYSLSEIPSALLREYLHDSFPNGHIAGAPERFDPQISRLRMEGNRITGCLLATAGAQISVDWFASQSSDKLTPLYLLRGALAAAETAYPPETPVLFAVYEPAVCRLTEKLFPDAQRIPVQGWELADGPFRLIDTTPQGWEEE